MLIGTLASTQAPHIPENLNSVVGVLRSPSVEALATDLAVGTCDVVVMTPPKGEVISIGDFSAACQFRPVSTVWMGSHGGDAWKLVASGRLGTGPPNIVVPLKGFLAAIRRLWVHGWATRVTAGGPAAQPPSGAVRLPAKCFLKALTQASAPSLAGALGYRQRGLQRRLSLLGFHGPQRFLLSARVFLAWEYSRIRTQPLERIALQLGYSSLSALDRSVSRLLGIRPHDLHLMDDGQLAGCIVRALRRGETGQLGQMEA